jgi:hypothetical protein
LQNVELTGYEGEAVICEGVKNIVTKWKNCATTVWHCEY